MPRGPFTHATMRNALTLEIGHDLFATFSAPLLFDLRFIVIRADHNAP